MTSAKKSKRIEIKNATSDDFANFGHDQPFFGTRTMYWRPLYPHMHSSMAWSVRPWQLAQFATVMYEDVSRGRARSMMILMVVVSRQRHVASMWPNPGGYSPQSSQRFPWWKTVRVGSWRTLFGILNETSWTMSWSGTGWRQTKVVIFAFVRVFFWCWVNKVQKL